MTLMTLILSSIVLNQVGLTGPGGIVSALIIGGLSARRFQSRAGSSRT